MALNETSPTGPSASSPRPGDDDFDGFRMQLPENCVEYMILIIDSGATATEPRRHVAKLEVLRKTAMQMAERLTKDYIWQRDAFSLEVRNEKGLFYLYGISDYGDSVEDEWLIAHFLRELSKSAGDDVWIRVSDSDGEFLLIEAAKVLPRWLSPEIDSHRAWIHKGELRIIPLMPGSDGDVRRPLTLAEAVDAIRAGGEQALLHSPLVEAEAFYRLEKYPGQINASLHHACVTIPRKLAYLLHARPKAVAPATEAFYLRDAASLRRLLSPPPPPPSSSSSSGATLVFPPTDLVTISVCFTKVLYAQLKSQRFEPPPAWAPLVRQAEAAATGPGGEEARKALERLLLGMKLTSGFEMLLGGDDDGAERGKSNSKSRVVREVTLLLEDLVEDGEAAMLPTDAAIRTWDGVDQEDDDAWMDVDYGDFERELDGKNRAGGGKQSGGGRFGDAAAHADLRKIVSRFEAFLNDDRAGLDGAEMDEMDEMDRDDDDDDDDDDDNDDDEAGDSEGEDKEVSFDEEQFARMMKEMMGLPPGDDGNAGAGRASKGQAAGTRGRDAKTDDGRNGDEDEDEEIRKLMVQMESELNEQGALTLDPTPRKLAALKSKGASSAGPAGGAGIEDSSDDGDNEIDVDYNLAKNLLESFRSQAGVAGPAGNILGLMGLGLPRDEPEEEEQGT